MLLLGVVTRAFQFLPSSAFALVKPCLRLTSHLLLLQNFHRVVSHLLIPLTKPCKKRIAYLEQLILDNNVETFVEQLFIEVTFTLPTAAAIQAVVDEKMSVINHYYNSKNSSIDKDMQDLPSKAETNHDSRNKNNTNPQSKNSKRRRLEVINDFEETLLHKVSSHDILNLTQNYESCPSSFVPFSSFDHSSAPTSIPTRTLTIRTLMAGDPKNPPCLFIHGHSMSSVFYFKNIDHFVSLGYCVYAIDLPGWASSSCPDYSGLAPHDVVAEYAYAIEAWRIKAMRIHNCSPSQKITILAHSMGAYYAAQYASFFPNSVQRLFLVAPAGVDRKLSFIPAFIMALTPQRLLRKCGVIFSRLLFRLKYPSDFAVYSTAGLQEYTYHLMVLPDVNGDLTFAKGINIKGGIAFNRWPLVDTLGEMKFPVDIIAGQNDPMVSLKECKLLHKELLRRNTLAELHVIRDASHCPHMEMPDEFFKIVKSAHEEDQKMTPHYANTLAKHGLMRKIMSEHVSLLARGEGYCFPNVSSNPSFNVSQKA